MGLSTTLLDLVTLFASCLTSLNKRTNTTTTSLSNVLLKNFFLRTGLSPSKDRDFPDRSKSALKNLLGGRPLLGKPLLLKRQRLPPRKSPPTLRKRLLLRRRPKPPRKRRWPLKRRPLPLRRRLQGERPPLKRRPVAKRALKKLKSQLKNPKV